MKSKIAIFGSCVTMDVFRSIHNNDYKENIEFNMVKLRLSLISALSNPIEYDEKDITILPDNSHNRFCTRVIKNDLKKDIFADLDGDVKCLILDLYFDLYFGVFTSGDITLTNNFWDYPYIDFYKNLPDKKVLSFDTNPHEYYVLWTRYCDKFFEEMRLKYPDVKIILNKVRLIDKIMDKDGNFYIEETFTDKVNKYNPLINLLEEYILANHDVIFMDFTNEVYSPEDHIWGKSFVHYNTEFYNNVYESVLRVCDGSTSKYFYDLDGKIVEEAELPNVVDDYKYRLRHYRNSHESVDNLLVSIKGLLKR